MHVEEAVARYALAGATPQGKARNPKQRLPPEPTPHVLQCRLRLGHAGDADDGGARPHNCERLHKGVAADQVEYTYRPFKISHRHLYRPSIRSQEQNALRRDMKTDTIVIHRNP